MQGGHAAADRRVAKRVRRTPYYRLTATELMVLKTACRCAGRRQEIAERMVLSPHTVRTHLSRIYELLGVGSLAEMVLFALYDEDLRRECFPQIKDWADE